MIQLFVSGNWNKTSPKVTNTWLLQSTQCNIIQHHWKQPEHLEDQQKQRIMSFKCKEGRTEVFSWCVIS